MTDQFPIPYVYILGASHSGSTLLAMLLNAHPEVATIGETAPVAMGNPDDYRCSCRALIRDCGFWRQVVEQMRRENPQFDLGRFGTSFDVPRGWFIRRVLRLEHRGRLVEAMRGAVLGLSPQWRSQYPLIAANCRRLAEAVLRVTGARVFVDSSKLAHRLRFLGQIPSIDLRVIHIVRDGRAVALTYMEPSRFADAQTPAQRHGGRGENGAAPHRQMSMTRAADEWRRCIRSAELALARIDRSRWIRVQYEDICADPQAAMERLFQFLAVDPSRALSDFRSAGHHVLGNGMRLDRSSEIRLDERWKSSLTDADLHDFELTAGRLNRHYGYD